MIKGIDKLNNKRTRLVIILTLAVVLVIVSVPAVYAGVFWGKIFPGVSISGVDVGGLNEQQAVTKLKNNFGLPENINFVHQENQFSIPTGEVGLVYKYEESINRAYQMHRTDNLAVDLADRFRALINRQNIPIIYELDEQKLKENVSVIAGQLSIQPVEPAISLTDGGVVVSKGQPGKDVDSQDLYDTALKRIESADTSPIEVQVNDVDPRISQEQSEQLKLKAEKIINKQLVLVYEDEEIIVEQDNMLNLLNFEQINDSTFEKVVADVKSQIERDPQNAVFQFQDGKVQEFKTAKDGLEVDEQELKQRFINVYGDIHEREEERITIDIPVRKSSPAITTSEVNDLGIKELIGKGESTYRGSIASRIYNIDLASSKFNGTLVAPGETFSFNQTIGDISVYTGYKQAYVIKDGKTVLGDGGGVCQVSTTMFRAALDAGLPIVERSPHSYRVGYYEQGYKAGLDATIYSPVTDLKFKNDTPSHILIQTISDPKSYYLAFEIYGTSDGRESSITNHYVSAPIPPPEDLYIDDPTLPEGTVKQIDWAAWGAKASFDYLVEIGGETMHEKTFYSNYRPWQAKFLRGTGPPDAQQN